jgi:hypothetical protein
MTIDEKGFDLLRRLIADIEGAPFPNTLDKELYLIWYEHVQSSAQEALEYLDERNQLSGPDEGEEPDLEV